MKPTRDSHGLTLIEISVALSIVAILAVILLVPMLGNAQARLQQLQCAINMRNLGMAILLYTNEYDGDYPRSWHSAGAHREPGWAMSIAPYTGANSDEIENDWTAVFNRLYRSPAHKETNPYIYSYALNVHFELDPAGDSYAGQPNTWRKTWQIPSPERTILLAQTRPVMFGDHLMAHLWSGNNAARNSLSHTIHDGRANYLFADGHVELLPLQTVFDPSQNINLFNPISASEGK